MYKFHLHQEQMLVQFNMDRDVNKRRVVLIKAAFGEPNSMDSHSCEAVLWQYNLWKQIELLSLVPLMPKGWAVMKDINDIIHVTIFNADGNC